MQLDFKHRTIVKYVANHPMGYVVVIEKDFDPNNSGFQVNIYKDTVASLGGEHIKNISNIRSVLEAKTRAGNAMETILSNLKIPVGAQ